MDRQDFACHLDEAGEYTMSKNMDYPSLAEISRLLHSRKVNLIFAVTEDSRDEYVKISELLREKARVATLTANSSNILEIVEKAYHEIVTKVVLRDNSIAELNLKYYSNCGKEGDEMIPRSECDELVEGKVYEFRVGFTLNECPKNQSLWVCEKTYCKTCFPHSSPSDFSDNLIQETSFNNRNKCELFKTPCSDV